MEEKGVYMTPSYPIGPPLTRKQTCQIISIFDPLTDHHLRLVCISKELFFRILWSPEARPVQAYKHVCAYALAGVLEKRIKS